MIKLSRRKKGQSVLEYIALFAFILSAFIVFQKYIWQGMAGRWKSVGDAVGQGRLYEKNATIDCAFDFRYTNAWYDSDCFRNSGCWNACYGISATLASCTLCTLGCQTPECNQ